MAGDDLVRLAVADANESSGKGWRVRGRLAGGVQSGAWRLESTDGSLAVLKLALTPDWAAQMHRAAAGVAQARAAGYPTPAWLLTGTLESGVGYQVQELIEGHTIEAIGMVEAESLIDVLERQSNIDPDPARNWNDFLVGDLGRGLDDLRRSATEGGTSGRELVAASDRLLMPALDWSQATRTDLVHGDFRPGNILFDDDCVAGVIDIEAIGSGSRAFDYATLLDHPAIEPDALELIIAAGAQAGGPDVLRTCFARVALDLVRFLHRSNLITEAERSLRISQLTDRARTIERLTRA